MEKKRDKISRFREYFIQLMSNVKTVHKLKTNL